MNIEEVYEDNIDKVYKFFYIKSLNKEIAEDLTSQTFMILIEQMQMSKDYVINDHKKFVYGVMRNVWLMYLRDKYARTEQSIEQLEDFESYVVEEVQDYEGQSPKERVSTYIDRLPERQKVIVNMRLIEELSIKDIAHMLDKDRNYVKTTYKRGIKSLRGLINNDTTYEFAPKEAL